MKKHEKKRIYRLILILVMVGGLGAYLSFIFIPDLQEFLSAKEKLQMQKSVTQRLLQAQKGVQERVTNSVTKGDVAQITQKELQKIFANFFRVTNIEEISKPKDAESEDRIYRITAVMESPKYFKELLHYINTKSYPLAILYPIEMKKMNREIEVTFLVQVYRSAQ